MQADSQTPKQRYQAKIASGEVLPDPAQAGVVDQLDELYGVLLQASIQSQKETWFGAITQQVKTKLGRAEPVSPVRGLYIWGGVGRGKTMLMDMFYDCLPEQKRIRMHFHRFMKRVHDGLNKWSGTANPLQQVATEIASDAQVLCFDEFFVSDIGDAMILAEVLDALFKRGVTLVATSNVEPKNLYENGLQRRRFLPAIDLLHEHTTVYHMDDGVDFRLRALEQAEIYHSPLDDMAHDSLLQSFRALAPDEPQANVVLTVEGREIPTEWWADDVVWFEFEALCEGPRSQNDYIELAMEYHAVFLSNVPILTITHENAARRFISLVDEFYDHGVKLIISAAAPILELYQGDRLRFEFERTQSRLLEMQSHDYLARSHKA